MDKFEQLIHDVGEMSESDQTKAIEEYKGFMYMSYLSNME